MDRTWKWKATGVLLLTLLALAMLVPSWAGVTSEGEPTLPKWFSNVFSRKLILGLDLQGGIHLQYKVDVPEALGRKTGNLAGSLELALKELGAPAKATVPGGATIDDSTTIVVTFEKPEDVTKIDAGFLIKHAPDHVVLTTEGPVVTLQMSTAALQSFQQLALEKAIETVERRINEFGVAESSVTRRGDSEIVVQIPGVKESEFAAAKEKLSQTGQLRFQIVDRNGWSDFYTKVAARAPKADAWPADLKADLKDHMVSTAGGIRATSRELLEYMVKGQVDDDHIVGYQEYWTSPKDNTLEPIESMTAEQEKLLSKSKFSKDAAFVKAYTLKYMFKKAGMSGENVERANVGYDQYNRAEVNMEFSKVDADNFYEMTKQYTQQQMAIMIDDVVFSDPNIKEPIPGGRVRIELGRSFGGQAQKEAAALVAVLKSGALQAPLRKVYDSQIGPTLGADSIEDGKMSVIIGFVGVALFMIIYYGLSGVVANFALAYNIILTLAMMAAFGATLTLPGIAGIVLGVGMAVDANVLIYERIREELRNGAGVRLGIDRGYEMALSSIVDSNLTTIIAAVVLYQYGSGPVRGFAVTLTIGIMASMFTALVLTRLIFEWMYFRGDEPKSMSV
jgi:preprotein translocase subunit SecD